MRLATHYALLDRSPAIAPPHITAATAFWEYAETSARCVFGAMLGDPVTDALLIALRQARSAGMSRTQIRDLFGRNHSGVWITRALSTLEQQGKAKRTIRATGFRVALGRFGH
jgi:hypothetical protein